MPTIRVDMFEGRTPEQKKKLITALTNAVVESLDAKPESVIVQITEMKKEHYATAGVQHSEKK